MTRDAFLAALRANLRGIPSKAADEIVADYASHFDEGEAHGRTAAEIAEALGDPARLARELRAEAGIQRFDQERSVSAAAAAILAILSLGAIDVLILFPILLAVFCVLFAFVCVAAAFTVAGLVMLVVTPFRLLSHDFLQCLFAGLGFLGGGLSIGSLVVLGTMLISNTLIRYGRFHMRLIKPVTA
jgi:uncharacterized membrane protein